MTWRWIFSLALALIVHTAWLSRPTVEADPGLQAQPTSEMIVAEVEPVLPPPAAPLPPPDRPDRAEPAPSAPQQFRPNTDAENPEEAPTAAGVAEEAAEETTTAANVTADPPPQPAATPVPLPVSEQDSALLSDQTPDRAPPIEALPARPKRTEHEIKACVTDYRRQLAGRFNDSFTKVPELITAIGDPAEIPGIDNHFGIAILAYSFVDHRPGAPFILFKDGQYQRLDEFDFSPYSNRIKDRMLYTRYRDQLKSARDQYGINALMKVIGLVPASTDRYFSSKQLRAVELAGLPLDQVRATRAHYAPYSAEGFNLIIDSVVTRDGRVIIIQDEELGFSDGQ